MEDGPPIAAYPIGSGRPFAWRYLRRWGENDPRACGHSPLSRDLDPIFLVQVGGATTVSGWRCRTQLGARKSPWPTLGLATRSSMLYLSRMLRNPCIASRRIERSTHLGRRGQDDCTGPKHSTT